ncbi:ABC transporter ATP-binding protein [Ramlibacter ginsenosidimutans]|uniref:ABC transporter ATP-binding protein n=1 Tax=Ramlibacter ginsenosidimutans TaxID=502333 RepID=A0A934TP06_9BURK|nr:ABC transporter ATP-binding protein [Ramlibacter ginsenosidimutans]
MSDVVLQTRGLSMAFGGLKVFNGLEFALQRGERHAVIGPNGAGKSTFVAVVTGLLSPTAGKVFLDGRDVTRTSARDRVKAGIVRTFQINTLFASLTPLESVLIALSQRDGVARPSLRPLKSLKPQIEEADALLHKFGLADDATALTQALPYGKQRLLEVVLAFALRPRVLLLDEPAAGLSTHQGQELFEQLATLTDGTTMLFVEHDMNIVFRYAQRVSVLAGGSVLATGTPEEIRSHDGVKGAYLGH